MSKLVELVKNPKFLAAVAVTLSTVAVIVAQRKVGPVFEAEVDVNPPFDA